MLEAFGREHEIINPLRPLRPKQWIIPVARHPRPLHQSREHRLRPAPKIEPTHPRNQKWHQPIDRPPEKRHITRVLQTIFMLSVVPNCDLVWHPVFRRSKHQLTFRAPRITPPIRAPPCLRSDLRRRMAKWATSGLDIHDVPDPLEIWCSAADDYNSGLTNRRPSPLL